MSGEHDCHNCGAANIEFEKMEAERDKAAIYIRELRKQICLATAVARQHNWPYSEKPDEPCACIPHQEWRKNE